MPTLSFATDNNHNGGICTGMSYSWAKTCLIRGRPPKSKTEMGMGHSIAAEIGQSRIYEKADDAAIAQNKGLRITKETSRTAKLTTTRAGRFKDAALEAATKPGVYLLCTADQTMAACHFAGKGGPQFAFFDPNYGQYGGFDRLSGFPSWYWTHVSGNGYGLGDSLLIQVERS